MLHIFVYFISFIYIYLFLDLKYWRLGERSRLCNWSLRDVRYYDNGNNNS